MMIELAHDNSVATVEAPGRVCFRIADITMELASADPLLKFDVVGAATRFVVEDEAPDVRARAAWGDLSAEVAPAGELLFDSGALWQLYREGEGYRFHFATPAFGPVPYKLASFNRDFTECSIILHRPAFTSAHVLNPLEYPLDELWMLNLLAGGRGAELHSCGIVDADGQGYLFIGQSGAGKTTTTRLWEREPNVRILSDDRIILRKADDGRFWMHGTPWHGEAELGEPLSAPLSGIYALRHGEQNQLVALGRAETAARLFSCSFPTYYYPAGLDFTLRFFDELTGAVPCHELSFVPDARAVAFVRRQSSHPF